MTTTMTIDPFPIYVAKFEWQPAWFVVQGLLVFGRWGWQVYSERKVLLGRNWYPERTALHKG